MDRSLVRASTSVCFFCRVAAASRRQTTGLYAFGSHLQSKQKRRLSSRAPAQILSTSKIAQNAQAPHQRQTRLSSQDASRLQRYADRVLHHQAIPPESDTLQALRAIEESARQVLGIREAQTKPDQESLDKTPASALLSLDNFPDHPGKPTTETIDFLSRLAYSIVKNERVDLTPALLAAYVRIQSLLSRPSTFPEIFSLYSTKPIAVKASASPSSTIQFKSPAQDAIATAVPGEIANLALSTAIRVKNLDLALGIINTTFRTKSFRRNKIFKHALPRISAVSLAPIAAYALASQFSYLQTNLPPESATTIAFAGLTTYAVMASMLGYVTLTTGNDQMERVTWIQGLPLWERWTREEERAACDAIAKAWGFKQKSKWGEEEGEQWEGLKEWLGVRGMVLDKVGLMEGME